MLKMLKLSVVSVTATPQTQAQHGLVAVTDDLKSCVTMCNHV